MNKKKKPSIKEIKEEIVRCLHELGVNVSKVILFGSMAKGDYTKYSDYDFLIITKETFTIKEKMKIASSIRMALAELYIPADVIINSEDEVEIKKNKIGYVTRYALKEGVEI